MRGVTCGIRVIRLGGDLGLVKADRGNDGRPSARPVFTSVEAFTTEGVGSQS